MNTTIPAEETEKLRACLKKSAESGGYIINPDDSFTIPLVESLITNEKRYGYQACPCRLASGDKNEDLDIICPCDYRDQDITEFGACYCGLYVGKDIAEGRTKLKTIPERRDPERNVKRKPALADSSLPFPVWRCSVCGYLCARDYPPEICPICKVPKERFELFIK